MICTSSGRAGSERAAVKTAADTIIANENVRIAERGRCSRASLDIGRPLGSPTILKTLSGHVMEDHSAGGRGLAIRCSAASPAHTARLLSLALLRLNARGDFRPQSNGRHCG